MPGTFEHLLDSCTQLSGLLLLAPKGLNLVTIFRQDVIKLILLHLLHPLLFFLLPAGLLVLLEHSVDFLCLLL